MGVLDNLDLGSLNQQQGRRHATAKHEITPTVITKEERRKSKKARVR